MPFDTAVPQPPLPAYRPPTPAVDVGSLISRTFSVWSKHLWLFAGFTLVLMIPVIVVIAVAVVGTIFAAGGLSAFESEPNLSALLPMLAVGVSVGVVATVVNMGGLTYGAIQGLAGRPVRFGTLFSVAFRRLFPLLGAAIVVGVLVGLGLLFLIVPGVIVGCGLAVVIPVVMAEKLGPIDAMGRSWSLTSGYKGTIFLTGLVFLAMNFAISLVSGVLGLIPILGQLAQLAISILMGSLFTIWPAVAYHDIRAAKEGVSTDDLAKVFE